MNFILLLLISALTFADCTKVWESENKKDPVVSRCAIDGIELVELKSGCSLEGGSSERCALLRSCDSKKEIGASVFRSSTPGSSYCLSGKEMEVMNSGDPKGPKAFITCKKVSAPESIRLMSSTQKKDCPFPFKDIP